MHNLSWQHLSFLLISSDTTNRNQQSFQPILCIIFFFFPIMLPLDLFHYNFSLQKCYYSLSTSFQAITMDICYWVYNFMLEAPPIKNCCINILSSDHNIIITFRDNEPHQGLLFSFSFMNNFGYCQELMKLKREREEATLSGWYNIAERVTGLLFKRSLVQDACQIFSWTSNGTRCPALRLTEFHGVFKGMLDVPIND